MIIDQHIDEFSIPDSKNLLPIQYLIINDFSDCLQLVREHLSSILKVEDLKYAFDKKAKGCISILAPMFWS